MDNGANIDLRDYKNNSALVHAGLKGNHGIVKYLLSKGADITTKDIKKIKDDFRIYVIIIKALESRNIEFKAKPKTSGKRKFE